MQQESCKNAAGKQQECSRKAARKNKEITPTDEGYKKLGKKGDMPSWQGPTKAQKISGKQIRINRRKFIDDQEKPNISASRPISNKDIRKKAEQIEDLKKEVEELKNGSTS